MRSEFIVFFHLSRYTLFYLFSGTFLDRVYLMGQSAGAHISACALLELAIKEFEQGENAFPRASQIKAYFGLSGG